MRCWPRCGLYYLVGATRRVARDGLEICAKDEAFAFPITIIGKTAACFVTVCAYDSRCIFGTVVDGEMRPNALGRIVEDEWLRTSEVRSYVDLDLFALMPNHIHGIILMRDERRSRDLAKVSKSPTLAAGSLGAIIGQFKSKVTKRVRGLQGASDARICQRNYFESVIRSEKILNEAREYIVSNPARWQEFRGSDDIIVEFGRPASSPLPVGE